jgi:hypothetical protein
MNLLLLAAALGSILVLTALAGLLRRALWPSLCPLCAGVAGTWMWLLAAHWSGLEVDLRVPALLLGGSAVGLANLGEKRLAGARAGAVLPWKVAVVVTGFGTAALLLAASWAGVAVGAVLLAALLALPALLAPGAPQGPAPHEEELLAQLRKCC